MASALFSSIQSLSTNLLKAIRGTPSTLHQQDPSSPVTDQRISVREDLEKLSRILARIQAIQQDAEEREIHDRSVRLWLEELRGVAYQAEDVLDDFYYEVLRSIADSGDAAIEAYHRDGGSKRKFAEMHTSSSVASYSFSITKVVIPDGMAEKIKGITESFQEISNARRDLHLREEDGTRLVIGTQIRPPTSSHVDERAIFGREKEKENIISVLNPLNDPQFTVLPIIGMGGLGKTTLAQLVYNDSKFLQLFDNRAWVSVSENFDLVCLTRAIIESVSDKPCEFSELSKLQDELKKKINHVRLFLVLDDVWNENTELWEHFQVALKGGKTVKILTTTRNTSVAEIMQTTSPIQLNCLPDEKCWSLFKHFAFQNREASENANLLEIGRCIVKKCKGSPLVTKVLGSILRYDMGEEKWREILKSDIFEIDENGKIFTPLQFSYQKLPLHLKSCFVYLAMFPKGRLIDKDHVVRLWMAQGYIDTNSSRAKKTLEEIGSEYLNELQGRSLIDFGDYNTCYVHDLIHDLARSISQRTNQPVLENDNLWNSSYKIKHLYLTDKHELSDLLPSCNNEVIRTYIDVSGEFRRNYIDVSANFSKITYVRALKLGNCMLPDTLNTLKHLRYLSIGDDKIESFPESLCLLYHLQTLDMDLHNIPELPENMKYLINLRFLRLCSGKIKQLPESISLLHNLDTLSIEFCRKLEKLPRSIEQLTNLRVLELYEDFVHNLPSGIGKLTNLITLNGKFIVTGSDMTQGLGELWDMNRLSGVMSISGLKNIGNIEYSRKANLVSKSNLRKLILNFEEDNIPCKSSFRWRYTYPFFYIALSSSTNAKIENNEKIQEGVLESLQPHGNLTELEILNYRGRRVPHWLLDPSLMSKLTTLTLYFQRQFLFLPPFLAQLLHLKSLKIYGSHGSEFLFANDPSKQPAGVRFLSHEETSFNNMLNLVEGQAGDKPCHKKLIINNCPKLWNVTIPQKVEVLEVKACGCQEIKFSSPSELKKLSISNCRELITIYYKSGDLPFLESISLSGCPNLSMLSAIPQKVEVLEVNACGCQEIKFSSPSELKKLSISNCRELITIYYKSGDLPFLESISLSGCPKLSMLSAIPQELKQLDIANCGIQEINFSSLSKLQKISIFNCRELNSINWMDGSLDSIREVSFICCPKLELQFPIKDVLHSSTTEIEIDDCPRIERDTTIEEFHLFGNNEILLPHSRIPFLGNHFTLILTKEDFLEVESLSCAPPVGVSCHCIMLNLSSLVLLEILRCRKVISVTGLDSLSNLKHLSISYCPMLCNWNDKTLPVSLMFLELDSCDKLCSLPFLSVQNHSSNLNVLVIKECPRLAVLEGFHGLMKLNSVELLNCRNISISPATESLQFRPHFIISDCPLMRDWCQRNIITYYELNPIDNLQDDREAEPEGAGATTKD